MSPWPEMSMWRLAWPSTSVHTPLLASSRVKICPQTIAFRDWALPSVVTVYRPRP